MADLPGMQMLTTAPPLPHSQVSIAEALSNVARSNLDTQTEIAWAGDIGPLLAIVTSRNPHVQAHDDP
jgi:hypothetical protein